MMLPLPAGVLVRISSHHEKTKDSDYDEENNFYEVKSAYFHVYCPDCGTFSFTVIRPSFFERLFTERKNSYIVCNKCKKAWNTPACRWHPHLYGSWYPNPSRPGIGEYKVVDKMLDNPLSLLQKDCPTRDGPDTGYILNARLTLDYEYIGCGQTCSWSNGAYEVRDSEGYVTVRPAKFSD